MIPLNNSTFYRPGAQVSVRSQDAQYKTVAPGKGNQLRAKEAENQRMSRRAKALSREMHILARQAGGSFKTIADRVKIAERVAAELYRVEYSDTIC